MLPCPLHLAAASVFACLGAAALVCAQPFEWQSATPESQGLSSEKLNLLQQSLTARRTTGLLVIRNDRVVLEWYADGHNAAKPHYTASMAKAIVGGLSLAVALTDGRIGLDDKASRFIRQWKDDAHKSKITIRQLGSHTSGLEDAEAGDLPHEKLTGWKGDFWKRLEPPRDPFTISRDETPVLFEPGDRFQYSNPGIAMLTFAATASLADAPEKNIRTLLRDRVMRPIGVPDAEWSAGYGKTFTVDGLPLVGSWGGGGYTARAVARVARLMLRGGDWDGRRLISKDAVRQVTTDAGTPGHGGIGWWSNESGKYARLPRDAFWGSGAGHQVVLVIPSLGLVAVRNGEVLDAKEEHHDALNTYLFEPLINCAMPRTEAGGGYFPPPESRGGWRKLDVPDEVRKLAGMDSDKLAALKDWLFRSDDRDFAAIVVRRGFVVLEVERNKSAGNDTGNIKSCAKAICATALAIASEESRHGRTQKKMEFGDPAFDFIPWSRPLSDPRKAAITVRQLFNHTSGLAPESTGARNQGPWEYVLGRSGDARTARLAFDPGTDLGYSTQGLYHAALVCEDVTGLPYDEFLIKMLLRPLGIEKWWFEHFDGGEGIGRHPSHELGLPAREMARIAYCALRGGRWNDRHVIPAWFIEETAAPTHSIKGRKDFGRDAESFSHAWELPGLLTDGRGKDIPKDARFKPGSGGQLIAFVPSLDLVATRQTGSSGQWGYEEYLRLACAAVLAAGSQAPAPAVRSPAAAPYPPSERIKTIRWAPKETTVRQAPGSDNWPLTWADDDALYGAYGDGNGFDSAQGEKLSLGLARIEGGPAEFAGTNIRSASIEQSGDGKAGKKASGLLMVDGVLYLWARNAANAQLAWSSDRGKTWSWSDWKFTASFGCPTFLNFGKGYAGARDDFVYVYSHDRETAYEPADRMVLARVPKEGIKERDGYEFLKGFGAKSEPIWTRDINERGAVFTNKGRCYRSGLTYNAGLRRYLWCQVLPGADPRFSGGFGVYDAPEPWGPWTTAFYTEAWDVGPGETSSFPAKWMSVDGKTIHLVFSGEDSFSVRKAEVELVSSE